MPTTRADLEFIPCICGARGVPNGQYHQDCPRCNVAQHDSWKMIREHLDRRIGRAFA